MTHGDRRLSCEETFRRLDDYVDRNLSADELELVERHLADCVLCAREYRFELSLLQGVRERLQRIAVPPHLLDAIRRRLDGESA